MLDGSKSKFELLVDKEMSLCETGIGLLDGTLGGSLDFRAKSSSSSTWSSSTMAKLSGRSLDLLDEAELLDLLKLSARLVNKLLEAELAGAGAVSSVALAELDNGERDGAIAAGGELVEFCLRSLSKRFAAKPIALMALMCGKSSFLALELGESLAVGGCWLLGVDMVQSGQSARCGELQAHGKWSLKRNLIHLAASCWSEVDRVT